MSDQKAASVDLDETKEAATEENKVAEPSQAEIEKNQKADENAAKKAAKKEEAEAAKNEKQMVDAPKGKLMVCGNIKEGGKILKHGSVYKGDNAAELFQAGALETGK